MNQHANLNAQRKGIADFSVGESFDGYLLVKQVQKGNTSSGAPFLNTTLGDQSGDITAMVWNADKEKEIVFQPKNIVKIKGDISQYRDKKQLTIHQYEHVQDGNGITKADLVKNAPISGKETFNAIILEVSNMKNDKIKQITLEILSKYSKKFKTHPAAKSVHHNYAGGLAYHTYSMMNVGKKIAELYPFLNRDLLIAGIILHDIGKVIEYDDVVGTDTTLEGRLKGHISIISEEIHETAKILDIDGEEVLILQHMVLSHHGLAQNGWGSPVSPQLIEAHVLHLIDMLDAGMDSYRNAVLNVNKGEWTERIFGLDNRSFYIPKI